MESNIEYYKKFYDSPAIDEMERKGYFSEFVALVASVSKYCRPPWVSKWAWNRFKRRQKKKNEKS